MCMVASATGTDPDRPRLAAADHPPTGRDGPAYAATGTTPSQACFHPASPPIAA